MEAPLFIREHARNIRHFVAGLIGEYSGWPGAADSSANEFICAEITAAIKAHEAAAWRPLSEKPTQYESLMIAVWYTSAKSASGKRLINVFQGMYFDGLWRVIADNGTGLMSYQAMPAGWKALAWRYWPRYIPLED